MIVIIFLFASFALVLLSFFLIVFDLLTSVLNENKEIKGKLPKLSAYGYGLSILAIVITMFLSVPGVN